MITFLRPEVERSIPREPDDLDRLRAEHYGKGGARLFDEDSVTRNDSGEFSSGGGHASAAIADEPFALGQAKRDKEHGGHSAQGSLFDTELHGAEARDLPGQTNFFDSKKWDDDRNETIRKSREAGNKHLDDVTPAVEAMRGRAIFNAHDHQERGVVRTVSNDGDVVVEWSDDHSAGKNSGLSETWLMPSDLKDYVFDDSKPRVTKWKKPKAKYSAEESGIDKSDSPTANLSRTLAEEFKKRGM